MRNSFVFLTFAFSLLVNSLLFAKKQEKVNVSKKSTYSNSLLPIPERSLLGIHLFDSSKKVASKYGSPTLLQDATPKEQDPSIDTTKNKGQVIKITKWIYKRNNSQYAFTIGEDGYVVQIECIGLQDNNVITHKKISLGDDFSKVIKAYGSPENYSLMDDYSVLRYNTAHHLEFKFSNTKAGQPLKVVGIILSSLRTINAKKENENKST